MRKTVFATEVMISFLLINLHNFWSFRKMWELVLATMDVFGVLGFIFYCF